MPSTTRKRAHTMTMKKASDPRRIYLRAGAPLLCFQGRYFTPRDTSACNLENSVRCEALPPSGGRHRITVTQKHGKLPATVETWKELEVVRLPRKASPAA
jgi:hypothetical protein